MTIPSRTGIANLPLHYGKAWNQGARRGPEQAKPTEEEIGI